MQMRVLSTRTMAEDGDQHKHNGNDLAEHKNNENVAAKHKNDAK